ncbi:MAG: glycosyltransferase, partial [Propionibacteriaceae bacterium]|nr:glycosyltransferase [Propionibacteriaceae bacterium]
VIDDLVCTIRPAPHDALFPRLAGVIHHGGAGTTAAALRAGVPSVAVPAVFDQYYHAHRLHVLGVGPAPVRLPKLSQVRLAGLLTALTSGDHDERAQRVGEQARIVDGTAATLAELNRTMCAP